MTPLDQHALVPKGPQAAQIAELWWFYLAVMALVCVLIWACVLVVLFRRAAVRGAAGEQDDRERAPALDEDTLASLVLEPEQPLRSLSAAGERRSLGWVLGATGATLALLFVLLWRSVGTSQRLAELSAVDAVQVEVVGHRWWWELRYVEADVSMGFTTANELHVPVGRPVALKLSSADVIHSFWVPNLHGKQDLVPGRESTLVLQADQPGAYRGQCAEFCGYSHAQMALWVIAESPARFEAWKTAQRALPGPAPNAEAERGQKLFLSGPCVMCHTVAGSSAQSSVGPDLTHVASRRSLGADTLPNTRGHLAGWLANAATLKPGVMMPNMSFESDQLHALIAYMESLK